MTKGLVAMLYNVDYDLDMGGPVPESGRGRVIYALLAAVSALSRDYPVSSVEGLGLRFALASDWLETARLELANSSKWSEVVGS